MAFTRPLWLLLLSVWLQKLMPPAAAAITISPLFEVTAYTVIVNGSRMSGTNGTTVAQCAALCGRLPGCGGFNLMNSNGRCVTLLKSSLQFSFRRTGLAVSGVEPARTCRQRLLQEREAPSGVQWLAGWPVPVFCDQELDGGGWTLLVAAVTGGWTVDQVLARNQDAPSLDSDYSLLGLADRVLAQGNGTDFSYRLEGQAQTGRQQWGAIITAVQPESLISFNSGEKGEIVTQFGDWRFGSKSLGDFVPWINNDTSDGRLLRTKRSSTYEYGTIISGIDASPDFDHSPWIYPDMKDSGTVLYWIREN